MLGILSWLWSDLEEGAGLVFTFAGSWFLGKPLLSEQSPGCGPRQKAGLWGQVPLWAQIWILKH